MILNTHVSQTPVIEKSEVRADVLVECIRNSSNPQVQQQALLLVSILASIVPELIIHNVMPIFTFMNSSIMKRTDDYSAHIVKQVRDRAPNYHQSLMCDYSRPWIRLSHGSWILYAGDPKIP